MFIIFNTSGALVGILGVMLGSLASAAAGRLWPGVLLTAVVWIVASILWRRSGPKPAPISNPYHGGVLTPPTGPGPALSAFAPAAPVVPIRRRRWPSVFFIPLFIWAVPLFLLTPMIAMAEHGASHQRATDPREGSFGIAKTNLRRSMVSGDRQIAQPVIKKIGGGAFAGTSAEDTRVYAESREGRVLVLVRIGNLKQFSDAGKGAVLDEIVRVLRELPATKDKRPFVQVRGTFMPGAMQIGDNRRIGSAVSDGEILAYFGDAPAPVPQPDPGTPR